MPVEPSFPAWLALREEPGRRSKSEFRSGLMQVTHCLLEGGTLSQSRGDVPEARAAVHPEAWRMPKKWRCGQISVVLAAPHDAEVVDFLLQAPLNELLCTAFQVTFVVSSRPPGEYCLNQ